MKKRVLALSLSILFLALISFGCHSKPLSNDEAEVISTGGLETYIISGTNSNSLQAVASENVWQSSYFSNSNVSKELQINIFGKSYFGQYEKSITRKATSYVTNYYRDGNGVEFGVMEGTNQLVYLNLMTPEYFDTEPYLQDVASPEAFAISCAKELATDVIEIADYEMSVSSYHSNVGENGGYDSYLVTFAKIVKGFYSADYVTFRITAKGHLASFVAGEIGAFDDFPHIESLDDSIKVSINMAIAMAEKQSAKVIENTQIDKQRLVRLPDGEYAIYSQISSVWKHENEKSRYSSGIDVITKIGELVPSKAPTE